MDFKEVNMASNKRDVAVIGTGKFGEAVV